MAGQGYIKISRRILDMPGYFGEKFNRTMCWIDLLLLARFSEEASQFSVRGVLVSVKRGQVAISLKALSERWGLSVNTVQSRLADMRNDGRIDIQKNNVINIITIVNYEKYQSTDMQIDIQTDIQVDMQVDMQVDNIIRNVKNDNIKEKRNNINIISKKENDDTIFPSGEPQNAPVEKQPKTTENNRKIFRRPTVEEVRAYCQERNNGISAESFVNFYESKGWVVGKSPMKDWKAAVRTWEQKNRNGNGNNISNQNRYGGRRGYTDITATGPEDYSEGPF